jgi:transcriptional regulator with XRE-family HTH domain
VAQEVAWARMTGAELRALRQQERLSRPALAALAGLHPDTVKYWERKALVDLRGHAPDRILKALGAEHLSRKGKYPGPRFDGGFCGTSTRARDRVLSAVEQADLLATAQFERRMALRASTARVRCGAKTRKGTPCRAKSEPGRKRCRFHGGLSTGPKTREGRARIAEAQRKRWRRHHKMAE